MPCNSPSVPFAIALCTAVLAFLAAGGAAADDGATGQNHPTADNVATVDGVTRPIPLIFDTDLGNDIDDSLALAVIHALHSRHECELLAVTSTKDHPLSGPFIDVINTFYGRGDIPIGTVCNGVTPEIGPHLALAEAKDDRGRFRYPHDLTRGCDALKATTVLRRVLSRAADGSVVVVQVGFSTNLAALLRTPGDTISPLDGRELVAKKVRLLSLMGGDFQLVDGRPHGEFNIVNDLPAARHLVQHWPTPIVFSGFEIGIAITYPAASIENDFDHSQPHPVVEAYRLHARMPYDRPTWDLTSVLYAVRPDRDYFGLSPPGVVTIDDDGITSFRPAPHGPHRYLTVSPRQITRVREALTMLASQPPDAKRDE